MEKPRSSGPAQAGKFDGASFLPDLTTNRAAVESVRWFWVGTLPGSPVQNIDLAGINFPMLTERVSRLADGQTKRVPIIGNLVKLTKAQVELMRERMSRTVIRFRTPKAAGASSGVGGDVAVGWTAVRKGQVITIPTQRDIELREKNNLPTHRYEQQPLDEPAADYLFAQACPNQSQPARGSVYPPPLSKTGLVWPDEPVEAVLNS